MKLGLVFIILFCISFSQKEIQILRTNLDYNLNQFENDVIQDVISELNKTSHQKFSLVFPDRVSKNTLVKELKSIKAHYSIAFSSQLIADDDNSIETSIPYLKSEYSLYMLKTKHLSEKWRKEYKRIGFRANTVEESIVKMLQNSGTFIAIPLKGNNEKMQLLKSGKLDFFIGDQFLESSSIKKVIDINTKVSKEMKMLFGADKSLKALIDPILEKYISTSVYQKRLVEAKKRNLDVLGKSDLFVSY